jgi:hypothetical protein
MSSLFLILLCCFGSLIIYLWFYSDFFPYYFKTFRFLIPQKIYNWLLIEDFFTDQNTHASSYIEYLYIKRHQTKSFVTKFFLKLFGCIICFTTWMSIIISLIVCNILYIGLIFLMLRGLDFILRFTNKHII